MGISLIGNSGDKKTETNISNFSYADSFNRTFSSSRVFSDVGNIYFGWDPNANSTPATAGGGVSNLGPYLVAGAFIIGGLFLLNKK